MLKKILISASLIAIMTGIIFAVKSARQYDAIKEKGKFTTCQITTLGSNVIGRFVIDGIEKRVKFSKPNKDIISGEIFKLYYYDKIPDKYYIAFEEPVFDITEYFKVIPLKHDIVLGDLCFTYEVGGKKYKRFQEVDKLVKKQLSEINANS